MTALPGLQPAGEGLLYGVVPGSLTDVDYMDPSQTIEGLFALMRGAPLLEVLIGWYKKRGDYPVHLWEDEDQHGVRVRSVVKHPLSRAIQETTIQLYTPRMQKDGLSRLVGSGGLIR